jgi:hypothetical protein
MTSSVLGLTYSTLNLQSIWVFIDICLHLSKKQFALLLDQDDQEARDFIKY